MELPPIEFYADKPESEQAGIIGRYAVMKELHLPFTKEKYRQIARNEMKGYQFWGAVSKTWNGYYGEGGLDLAEAEIAATYLEVYDEVFGYRETYRSDMAQEVHRKRRLASEATEE